MMVVGRRNLPQLGLIDRYLARSIAVPLLGTLVLAAMLLVLDKMLRLFQYVVDAGGPVSVVWRMLANLLPEYLSLGIPIGLMLGILLAFRKLALSSELDAMRGIGIGYGRPGQDPLPPDQRASCPGQSKVLDTAHPRVRQLRSPSQPAGHRPVPRPRSGRDRRALPPRTVAHGLRRGRGHARAADRRRS